jgi:hypothetical protein
MVVVVPVLVLVLVGVVVIVRRHGSELGGGIREGGWRLRIREEAERRFCEELARLVRRCSLTSGFLLADSRAEALRLFRKSGPNPNGLVAGLPASAHREMGH